MTPGIPILLAPRPGEASSPLELNVSSLDSRVLAAVLHDHHGFTVAIATVAMSGIDALSVGVVHGHNGLELLVELEARHGEIVHAPIVRAPDRSLVYLFQHRSGLGTEASVLPGIDVCADGGIVTLPPSDSGTGAFSWFAGRSPADLPPPPWPAWLTDLLKQESAATRRTCRGARWSIEAARALYRRLGLTGLGHMGRDAGEAR